MPDPRQKKLARLKKKRAIVHRSRPHSSPSAELAEGELTRKLVRDAQKLAAGPCFVAASWNDPSASRVLPVAISRRPAEGFLMMAIFLLDLGCRGIKDAFVTAPFAESRSNEILQNLANASQLPLEPASIEVVSSIVRAANGWGKKLGFEPDPEHEALLTFLSPPGEGDIEVTLGREGKVVYEPEPDEDTKPIVQKLVQAVGPDGFTVVLPRKEPGPQQP